MMVFYAIIGLHLFKGLLENRCRVTKMPVNGSWDVNPNIKTLCGDYQCPLKLKIILILINNLLALIFIKFQFLIKRIT